MKRLRYGSLFLLFGSLFFGLASAATLVVADFNNDGSSDFAVITATNPNVCVRLSNGDGTFQPPLCYAAGTAPVALVTGDLDGDGHLDLVALNPDRGPLASGLAVLRGQGDGTFMPISKAPFPAGTRPRQFALSDLNGDGLLDAAVLAMEGLCSVIGRGNGSFEWPRCVFMRGFEETHTLRAEDVNGDGRADFLGVSPQNICVWTGLSREPRCTPTRVRSRIAEVADFTGDGRVDVVVVGSSPARLNAACVYAGDGEGGFDLTRCTPFPSMSNINSIAVADLNGDGVLDLVLAGSGRAGGEVIVLLGDGEGGFTDSHFPVPLVPLIDDVGVGDFSGRGVLDILVYGSGRFCVFPGDGTGGFGDPQCFGTR